MYKLLKIPLSPQQQQALVNFVAKKVSFDKMALAAARSEEEKKVVEGKLIESSYLYRRLEARPQEISLSLARKMSAYLVDAGETYQQVREWLVASGDEDTREVDLEAAKAEILHEVLRELMDNVIKQ